jgi:NADPH-dependent 7-cyano-7-deazaguanine reductase QueF
MQSMAGGWRGMTLSGEYLDEYTIELRRDEPDAIQLALESGSIVEEVLYSRVIRSLRPVTGQPDWTADGCTIGGQGCITAGYHHPP